MYTTPGTSQHASATASPLSVLRQQARADGLRPLRLAGAMKVAEGLTTLDEVLGNTPPLS